MATPPLTTPSLEHELALAAQGFRFIAGLDEAGRGPIAGPVMVGVVILPLERPDLLAALDGVDDSKRLSEAKRAVLFLRVQEVALTCAVGIASSAEIDAQGIAAAVRLAARRALSQLTRMPDHLLVDGRLGLPDVPTPQTEIIGGDHLSLSIAAASILAKVSRDQHMLALDHLYPAYKFARHKGYCTAEHVALVEEHGPCPEHRFSFEPVKRFHGLM